MPILNFTTIFSCSHFINNSFKHLKAKTKILKIAHLVVLKKITSKQHTGLVAFCWALWPFFSTNRSGKFNFRFSKHVFNPYNFTGKTEEKRFSRKEKIMTYQSPYLLPKQPHIQYHMFQDISFQALCELVLSNDQFLSYVFLCIFTLPQKKTPHKKFGFSGFSTFVVFWCFMFGIFFPLNLLFFLVLVEEQILVRRFFVLPI